MFQIAYIIITLTDIKSSKGIYYSLSSIFYVVSSTAVVNTPNEWLIYGILIYRPNELKMDAQVWYNSKDFIAHFSQYFFQKNIKKSYEVLLNQNL